MYRFFTIIFFMIPITCFSLDSSDDQREISARGERGGERRNASGLRPNSSRQIQHPAGARALRDQNLNRNDAAIEGAAAVGAGAALGGFPIEDAGEEDSGTVNNYYTEPSTISK